ncbi:hypothetical protein LshimejAT787_0210400 [Lyophyllum shimeji]|uniref:Uncharacterized protein n=1 Tax=Lyophyllum shimeji TaxID=47721 RepID=A0A9P3PG84_LYOSH|nr:hypothetical protein LshimejAT787_0210400 [Lyophyllum shimeji]
MSVSILAADVPTLSASSSTASSSASSVSSIHGRRIRFAPLPDPRALDDDVDDDTIDHDDALHAAVSTCLPDSKPCSLSSSPSSDASDHVPASSKPITQQLLSHSPITHTPSWPKPKTMNLLRPFPFTKSKSTSSSASSHSLTPTQSLDSAGSPTPTNATPHPASFSRKNFSTEEILTLGTINLFRTSSKRKDTSASTDSSSGWGFGLTRWSSAGSYTKSSVPLTRTQSAQSYTPSISSKLKFGSLRSSKDDKPRPRPSSVISVQSAPSSTATAVKPSSLPTGRKGIRMLNGRVYGAAKRQRDPNANPFANARDDEPEFVEWGYGGMGSVRGGRHAGVTGDGKGTRWERLQSDATFMGTGVKKGVGGADVDEDDGSGMGWVRKRKEQRERERKEREEKEKAEREKKSAEEAPTSAEESTAATVDTETSPAPAVVSARLQADSIISQAASEPLSITVPSLAEDAPSSPVSVPAVVATSLSAPVPVLEHNLTAVTLPAHLSRHHSYTGNHRRTPSRTTSVEGVPAIAPASAPLPTREEVSSESESESEEDIDEYDEDEDEDEEQNEELELKRKTALGAGVEKISRHHD